MNIAMIPARGGSKRIPRKNIKMFHSKPIIAYSIESALESGCFDRVIVSTDDEEIANVARKYGAEVPFIRPEKQADDHATTLDVIKHCIETLKLADADILCCLYATAPFISKSDLINAIDLLQKEQLDFVFSATEFSFPIQRAFQLNQHRIAEMIAPEHIYTRSQDLCKSYHDAGQFYFGIVASFNADKSFFYDSLSKVIELPNYRVQDIDTIDDWKRAELLYSILEKENDENI